MKLSIIVGWRSDQGGPRDRSWAWVWRRWATLAPDAQIITADSDGDTFSYAQAANRAIRNAVGDLLLLASADIAMDATWLPRAMLQAAATGWALPTEYHYLTPADSDALLARPCDTDLELPPTTEYSGGKSWGQLCMTREAYEEVRGLDERHRGWGWEDICFAAAMSTLVGPHSRVQGRALHLWHPATHETTWIQPHCDEQKALMYRYLAAEGDPAAMRLICDEHGSAG